MTLDKYFKQFLHDIEPSKSTVDEIARLHSVMRDFLKSNETYKDVYIYSFLSGSYAKHTSIRPTSEDHKRDVDIDIVTNHDSSETPITLFDELKNALSGSGKYDNIRIQTHSIRVIMSKFSIDIVPLVKDSSGKFLIGSTNDSYWQYTDPVGHKEWCSKFNAENNNKFVPLVKLIKWWRQENCPDQKRYPKGITLEKIIADNIGDTSLPYESLLIETFTNILNSYQDKITNGSIPAVQDPSVPDNNLLEGYELSDLKGFLDCLDLDIQKLNTYGLTNKTWKAIMGDAFPSETPTDASARKAKNENYRAYLTVPQRKKAKWPMPPKPSIRIIAEVTYPDGVHERYQNDGKPLPKGTSIDYRAAYAPHAKQSIKWQIVNTGDEAMEAKCLRGEFEESNNMGKGNNTRYETTAYTGKHYVQCFIIKNAQCTAYSEPFFINVE